MPLKLEIGKKYKVRNAPEIDYVLLDVYLRYSGPGFVGRIHRFDNSNVCAYWTEQGSHRNPNLDLVEMAE